MGGGVSGRSAANLALRRGDQPVIFETDVVRSDELRSDGFAVMSGEWSPSMLIGFETVIVSPGLPESAAPIVDALSAGLPLVSEIEWASRLLEAPYAAVTGTNGKTTVTSLIADIVQAAGFDVVAAGNIGLGLSDVADRPWDRLVIEVSSFQLRFIDTFKPAVAVLLNVADDHLDWHKTRQAYEDAKARIFENAGDDGVLIFDADDPGASRLAKRASGRVIPVSGTNLPEGGYGVAAGELTTMTTSISLADLRVTDRAYRLDLVAAAVAAELLGATSAAVEQVLRAFEPGHHRRTLIGKWNDVAWINDSKATNPHAAVAACRAFPSVVLIAGGRNKGLSLEPITQVDTIRYLIALGEAAPELMSAWAGAGQTVESLEEAVAVAAAVAQPGDTVLLAPGCASFDMFSSYEARGDAFERAVRSFQGVSA